MDSDEELFLTHSCFLQEVLEPYFSMSFIIGETGNDLESDPQDSLHEDLKEILSEEKSRKDRRVRQIRGKLQQARRRMIAIIA